ncbi:CAP-Gly domain-containing linker protein 1-like [Protopterus annectens]|uniref:CAP-Gly domain-containing linker protein 1-like n=1 Tax=Protopterus annectens TaxID=7888 RepID=UPI001CFB9EB3|nr:CAP-Gly domain-containing linker protein 1-like [Protopterus annectens]
MENGQDSDVTKAKNSNSGSLESSISEADLQKDNQEAANLTRSSSMKIDAMEKKDKQQRSKIPILIKRCRNSEVESAPSTTTNMTKITKCNLNTAVPHSSSLQTGKSNVSARKERMLANSSSALSKRVKTSESTSRVSTSSRTTSKRNLNVGNRVLLLDGSNREGTIRYLGKTSFADREWCGIQLSTPTGKNDGSVNRIRYFTCQPKYGLFVPPSRVVKISFPRTISSTAKCRTKKTDTRGSSKFGSPFASVRTLYELLVHTDLAFCAQPSTSWMTPPIDDLVQLIVQHTWRSSDTIEPIPRRPDKILSPPEGNPHWYKGLPVDAMVVAVATKKAFTRESPTVHPPNRESRVIDRLGKWIYSTATFAIWPLNYLADFTWLQKDLISELSKPLAGAVPDEDKPQFKAKLLKELEACDRQILKLHTKLKEEKRKKETFMLCLEDEKMLNKSLQDDIEKLKVLVEKVKAFMITEMNEESSTVEKLFQALFNECQNIVNEGDRSQSINTELLTKTEALQNENDHMNTYLQASLKDIYPFTTDTEAPHKKLQEPVLEMQTLTEETYKIAKERNTIKDRLQAILKESQNLTSRNCLQCIITELFSEIDALQSAISKLFSEREILKRQKDEMDVSLQAMRCDNETLRKGLEDSILEKKELSAHVQNLSLENNRVTDEKNKVGIYLQATVNENQKLINEKNDLHCINHKLLSEKEEIRREKDQMDLYYQEVVNEKKAVGKEMEKAVFEVKELSARVANIVQENCKINTERNITKMLLQAIVKENENLISERDGLQSIYSELLTETEALRTEKHEMETNLQVVMNEIQCLATDSKTLREELEKSVSEVKRLSAQVETLTDENHNITDERNNMNVCLKAILNENKNLTNERDVLPRTYSELLSGTETRRRQKAQLDLDLQMAMNENQCLSSDNVALHKQLRKSALEVRELNPHTQTLAQENCEIKDKRNIRLQAMGIENKNLASERESLQSINSKLLPEIEVLGQEIDELGANLHEVVGVNKHLTTENEALHKELQKLVLELKELNASLQTLFQENCKMTDERNSVYMHLQATINKNLRLTNEKSEPKSEVEQPRREKYQIDSYLQAVTTDNTDLHKETEKSVLEVKELNICVKALTDEKYKITNERNNINVNLQASLRKKQNLTNEKNGLKCIYSELSETEALRKEKHQMETNLPVIMNENYCLTTDSKTLCEEIEKSILEVKELGSYIQAFTDENCSITCENQNLTNEMDGLKCIYNELLTETEALRKEKHQMETHLQVIMNKNQCLTTSSKTLCEELEKSILEVKETRSHIQALINENCRIVCESQLD